MDEVFEHTGLLTRERLRELQVRRNAPSALRLALHLAALYGAAALTVHWSNTPLSALAASIALAWVWATIFAPFHECTHRTAFRSRRANAIGAWLTGIPFGMAPAVYRVFHFAHHRHTQDPDRDPEIVANPDLLTQWPTKPMGWLVMASGYGLLTLKYRLLLKFALTPPATWDAYAPWVPAPAERVAVARECRVLLFVWTAFIFACLFAIDGGGWLIAALFLAHAFEALWLVAEHTGLPLTGTIMDRTRSVKSNAFVRWWLWNMNYHTEHHAWPGIPWHQLGAAHAQIDERLEHRADGYAAIHRAVLSGHPAV